MEKKKEKRKPFYSILISIITYGFFLGIGYIIGLFFEIPAFISYSIFFLFGFLAVAVDIPDDKMKILKQLPLLRRHFSLMHRVNQKLGDSAQEGNLKSAFKFVIGIISITLYLFWMNIMIISIKYLLNLTIGTEDPFRFTEAFFSLLGAGIMAYFVWLKAFYKDNIRIKTLFSSGNLSGKIKSFSKSISLGMKLMMIFFGYLIFVGALSLFLLGTSFYNEYLLIFLYGCAGFWIFLSLLLLLIFLITKPKK
ncbi:hypothetical protein NEF87_003176 [Candidatus Lokiarchaeum ossiferum]|uniref:Uncharacterized protein n=1 Tax=Candidatus Lokiarchaeum ossiferum TaxID=2951803 RepID=A0ABY6HWD4_9ARCH|nr:hypothetical protein NEF87_003176 [Candidatus Lokiarchaeum sp. B-35]